MTDTATRLVGPIQLTAAAATYYTVPALTTVVVRHILFTNVSANTETVTLSFGADGATTRLFNDVPVFSGGVIDWTGFQVIEAAEIIQALCSSAVAVNLTISGVEIT